MKYRDYLELLVNPLAGGSGGGGGGSATLIEKSISANGTYNAADDSADGYSKAVVAVQGGFPADYVPSVPQRYVKCNPPNVPASVIAEYVPGAKNVKTPTFYYGSNPDLRGNFLKGMYIYMEGETYDTHEHFLVGGVLTSVYTTSQTSCYGYITVTDIMAEARGNIVYLNVDEDGQFDVRGKDYADITVGIKGGTKLLNSAYKMITPTTSVPASQITSIAIGDTSARSPTCNAADLTGVAVGDFVIFYGTTSDTQQVFFVGGKVTGLYQTYVRMEACVCLSDTYSGTYPS